MAFMKDNLATAILQGDPLDRGELMELARLHKYPNFEVRTVGSAGLVQIRFPNQEWMKPDEWALNHVNHIMNNLNEAVKRASLFTDVLPDLSDFGYYSRNQIKAHMRQFFEQQTRNCDQEGIEAWKRWCNAYLNLLFGQDQQ